MNHFERSLMHRYARTTWRPVRFAPSPTGDFHIGNLRTAWISWRWAQFLNQPWIVRFEDIDKPRILKGAKDSQLNDLNKLGLKPDEIITQSERHSRHWQLFQAAIAAGQVYPCICSRKEVQAAIATSASAPHSGEGPAYNGRCRNHHPTSVPDGLVSVGWRFKNENATGAEDFIVARSSDLNPDEKTFAPAYHWACALDDWDGQYALLVRAHDLASATTSQRQIQSWLAKEIPGEFPAVFHTSLVVQEDGHRLEKRTKGVTLDELLARGHTTEEILESFNMSFDSSLLRKPGSAEIGGELSKTIPLTALV